MNKVELDYVSDSEFLLCQRLWQCDFHCSSLSMSPARLSDIWVNPIVTPQSPFPSSFTTRLFRRCPVMLRPDIRICTGFSGRFKLLDAGHLCNVVQHLSYRRTRTFTVLTLASQASQPKNSRRQNGFTMERRRSEGFTTTVATFLFELGTGPGSYSKTSIDGPVRRNMHTPFSPSPGVNRGFSLLRVSLGSPPTSVWSSTLWPSTSTSSLVLYCGVPNIRRPRCYRDLLIHLRFRPIRVVARRSTTRVVARSPLPRRSRTFSEI